jgi:hypothetical protein
MRSSLRWVMPRQVAYSYKVDLLVNAANENISRA